MKDLLIFWIPGAGKWTQASLLTKKFGWIYAHLSTWDIFRALTWKPNAIWDYVVDRMNSWKLIDDQVTIALFNAYFYAVLDDEKHMLLDGYPRTVIQLESFLALAKKHNRELLWIYYTLSDEEALKRLIGRWREWETADMLQIRLQEYYIKTKPIIDLFAKHELLVSIDAQWTIGEIHEQTIKIIEQYQ